MKKRNFGEINNNSIQQMNNLQIVRLHNDGPNIDNTSTKKIVANNHHFKNHSFIASMNKLKSNYVNATQVVTKHPTY